MPVQRQYRSAARVPLCLCLDVSGSVSANIDILNTHVRNIFKAIQSIPSHEVVFDMAAIKFGGMLSSKVHDVSWDEFFEVGGSYTPDPIVADEKSPMGKAVKDSYNLLDTYKKAISGSGMHYYQPVLIVISDGQANCGEQDLAMLRTYQKKIRNDVAERKLLALSIGIGRVNAEVMNGFLQEGEEYLRGRNIDFGDLIRLLSATAAARTESVSRRELSGVMGRMARAGREDLR